MGTGRKKKGGSCCYRTPRRLRRSYFHDSKRRSRRSPLNRQIVIWKSLALNQTDNVGFVGEA